MHSAITISTALLAALVLRPVSGTAQTPNERAQEIEHVCDSMRTLMTTMGSVTIELPDHGSSEGAEALAYLDASGVFFLRVTSYGETGRSEIDHYFRGDSLICTHDRSYTYNRPIYWDLRRAAANGDSVIFDPAMTVMQLDRYFFEHHVLILWLDPTGKPVDLMMGTNGLVGQGLIAHARRAVGDVDKAIGR